MNDRDDSHAHSEKEIFFAALDQPNDEARAAFLDGACGKNPNLRRRIEDLLADHFEQDTFLQTAAVDGAPTITDITPVTEGTGSQIDRYKLLQKLGEGGFGVVYMAEQKEPVKRRVALKIIKLGMDTKQVVARFEAERQALAMMDHPNIAKVLDAGSTETGRPYFVMELVKGVAITKYCDDNNLTTKERLDLFIPVCQAIQHAHQKGIIHRDIKPSNVMITLHDGVPVPKVIDFGIAKATQQELTEKTIFTQYSQFIGTPAYMSPEQAEMSGLDIDTRSDIYSLGVLLYELLVGKTPLDSKELMSGGYDEIRRRIKEEEPPKPSTRVVTMEGSEKTTVAKHRKVGPDQLSSDLRGDLDWIVLKALEKDRTRRYETANGFVLDIKRFLNDEPVTAVAPSSGYLFKKYVRRHKTSLAVAATIAGLLIVGIATSSWLAVKATRAQRVADAAQIEESEQRLLAQKKQREAEAASKRELVLRQEAVASERKQRLSAYASDMRLAHRYIEENELATAKTILKQYEDQESIRGIYWYRLNGMVQSDRSHTLPHETMVRSISLSADGTRLASQTLSGRVRLYDVPERRQLWQYGGGLLAKGAREGSVAVSPDGRLVASDQQGTLKVWDAETAELVFERRDVVAPVAFTRDSQRVAGVTEDGLHFWDTTNGADAPRPDALAEIDTRHTACLTFSPDGKHIIFAPSRFGSKLIIVNLETGKTEGELVGLNRPSVVSTDGQVVAAGGEHAQVALWDLKTQKPINIFKAHSSFVMGVSLSPDGTTLATGGNDALVTLWDTRTFKIKARMRGHQTQIWNVEFSEDGSFLASAAMDQSVKLWDWQSRLPKASGSTQPSIAAKPAPSADADLTQRAGPPATHTVNPGESIQTAIDVAQPGDRVYLAAGMHPIDKTVVVNKPLTIVGAAKKGTEEKLPTLLQGRDGFKHILRIETASPTETVLQDLRIESVASGIQYSSGNITMRNCQLTTRSVLDFNSVIGLQSNRGIYSVLVDNCDLSVQYVGNTIESTPPDVDVFLVGAGARFSDITVSNCRIRNDIPNAISNGIECRSIRSKLTIRDNDVRTMGLAVVVPNFHGTMEIRDNKIWSTNLGINVGSDEQEMSYITGNQVTIKPEGLPVYPNFLRNYIAGGSSACMSIGHTSAGVTAGFFLQEVIGSAANFRIENNTLLGNPKYGIAMIDSADPEKYGPYTPNTANNNTITRNDFSNLNADRDIALGASTHDNQIFDNIGLNMIFKEAGENDRNSVSPSTSSTGRYVEDRIKSPALEGNLLNDPATRPLWVWLPPGYDSSSEKRYPVVYLLHGFTGDHNQFKNASKIDLNISEIASELMADDSVEEFIAVMPDASNAYGGSFYGSNEVIGDYRNYIARDLVNYIDAKYPTIPNRKDRHIAGNSMGAYGALSLAMEFSDVFGSVAAMSPSADRAVAPTRLDQIRNIYPDALGNPAVVRTTEELRALLSGNVMVNLFYAEAAACSPNPNNPPYYVDLPLSYPEKTTISDVWNKWLDQDAVSEIERNGHKLKNTDIFIDIGVGPVTIMPEGNDIDYLLDALKENGVEHTFIESPGDHLSHLKERTIEVLKFLSSPDTYSPPTTQRLQEE